VAHEVSEHIEHAAHEPGHQGNLTRWIGLTIAVVGVLMALSAAEVGAARTDLIATMVDENGAKNEYQTVSTKYRTLQAVLQHLHAAMPELKLMEDADKDLTALTAEVKNPDTAQGIKATRLETKKVLSAVIPTGEDVTRFMKLVERHEKEAEAAKEWAGSYRDAIDVHKNSAANFELAQVAAEIAIVIASVGLLLQSRKVFAKGAWVAAMLLGALSLTLFAGTYIIDHQRLHGAKEKIHESQAHFKGMIKEEDDVAEDRKLIEDTKKAIEKLEKLMNHS
jgi:hypothetical protein